MKTLKQQFEKRNQLPRERNKNLDDCHAVNNFIGLQIIHHIVNNDCVLEHRETTSSEKWKPGTLREFLKYYTVKSAKEKWIYSFDGWMLNFWRIKTHPTEQEIYDLTHTN